MGPVSFPPPREPFLFMLERQRQERETAQRWKVEHGECGTPPGDIRHEFERGRGRPPRDGNPFCKCGKRKRDLVHFTERLRKKKPPRTIAAYKLITLERGD